jgi:hypothetical protein
MATLRQAGDAIRQDDLLEKPQKQQADRSQRRFRPAPH